MHPQTYPTIDTFPNYELGKQIINLDRKSQKWWFQFFGFRNSKIFPPEANTTFSPSRFSARNGLPDTNKSIFGPARGQIYQKRRKTRANFSKTTKMAVTRQIRIQIRHCWREIRCQGLEKALDMVPGPKNTKNMQNLHFLAFLLFFCWALHLLRDFRGWNSKVDTSSWQYCFRRRRHHWSQLNVSPAQC